MMIRAAFVVALFLLLAHGAGADARAVLAEADELNEEENHQDARDLLENALARESSPAAKAEIYWRLARAYMYLGDDAEREGAPERDLLAYFERGEQYGQLAIQADPANFNGYFWKAGNSGRWGQVRGVLKALAKAHEMRELLATAVELEPSDPGCFYVLGQLYDEVPGLIAFGDIVFAVSLGRKSVDLFAARVASGEEKEFDYDYYTELAKHLYKRNWDAGKRTRSQAAMRQRYQEGGDVLTRNLSYEGTVTLPNVSDREEARQLVTLAIQKLRAIPAKTRSQEADLAEAMETLEGFK